MTEIVREPYCPVCHSDELTYDSLTGHEAECDRCGKRVIVERSQMLLALDVGFRNCGWAVIEKGQPKACGVITTEKASKKSVRQADDNMERAAKIAAGLGAIVSRYDIQGIVGELPSGGAQSATAMKQMSMATAILGAVSALLNLPFECCTPNDVKMAVTGKKSAGKDEIMDKIRKMYSHANNMIFPKTKKEFEHVADAIGAYLALKNNNLAKMFG